jgi:DNA polymerase III delta prime subunit
MRQIKITKYEGNTHYSVYVIDSFGQEHHLGYYTWLNDEEIEKRAKIIWLNEQAPCPEQELEAKAIKAMIDLDIKNGRTPSLD